MKMLFALLLLIPSTIGQCISECYATPAGCTLSPVTCLQCNTEFYLATPASATACTLNPRSIYNQSIQVSISSALFTIGTYTWNYMYVLSTQFGRISITNAYYGLRCHMLMYVDSGLSYWPSLEFAINYTYTEQINIGSMQLSPTGWNFWDFTTKFYPYNSKEVLIIMRRNDNNWNNYIGFGDLKCVIANCVTNCLACTSLSTCQACAAGFILEAKFKHCIPAGTCPLGQYLVTTATPNYCQFCDPKCMYCSDALTCTNCTSSGLHESFLFGTQCYYDCPNTYLQNYQLHTCECPQGYVVVGVNCVPCHSTCKACMTGPGANECTKCIVGYFWVNQTAAFTNSTCVMACPIGQYPYFVYDLGLCYFCDANCYQCEDKPTYCTSCQFATNNFWLYDHTCVSVCPSGYEANNVTYACQKCMMGMFSFENVCVSQCPQFYEVSADGASCVLPGGFPLNMTYQFENASTIKFTIPLKLGMDPAQLLSLNTTWPSFISLEMTTVTQSDSIINPIPDTGSLRLLQQTQLLNITNAVISNSSIVLYVANMNANSLANSNSFQVRFVDNLRSFNNIIYQISVANSTSSSPGMLRYFFQLNMPQYFLIGTALFTVTGVILLMQLKYIYVILVQYIHCMQIFGLVLFSLYPYAINLDMYSFVQGFDFTNFSFMYNVPLKLIPACTFCPSLISYTFALGDMNWLRMMGALLVCLVIMAVLCAIVYAVKLSTKYTGYFVRLVADLVIIKSVHGWFASLIYAGLNYERNLGYIDVYEFTTHVLSYFLMVPILYVRFTSPRQNKFTNISLVFLIALVVAVTLVSLSPRLVCSLMVLISILQWVILMALKEPEENLIKTDEGEAQNVSEKPFAPIRRLHTLLLRLMKPITCLMVALVMMIANPVINIAVISSVFGLYLFLIILDCYLFYSKEKECKTVKPTHAAPIEETKENIDQSFEDIKNLETVIIPDQDDVDELPVGNRFRKKKARESGFVNETVSDIAVKNKTLYDK